MREEGGASRFQCASPELETLCEALAQAADERPVTLREVIASAPSDKLRNFADAFRLKRPDKEGSDE